MGWPQVEVNVMTVRDALHQFELEVSENENRKDFTFSEKMQWAKLLKDEYSAQAKARQGSRTDIQDTCPECSGQARDAVAEFVGISSGRTLSRAEYIMDHATPEIEAKAKQRQQLGVTGDLVDDVPQGRTRDILARVRETKSI